MHILSGYSGKRKFRMTENDSGKDLSAEPAAPITDKQENTGLETTERKDFSAFGLHKDLIDCLQQKGWTHPTLIQEQSLPLTFAKKDVVGLAQTGSGKTGAFLITLAQNVLIPRKGQKRARKKPLSLVICPVRELATQIQEEAVSLLKPLGFKTLAVFGGANIDPQIKDLENGVDLVVATPGRLIDLHERDAIDLSAVEIFVCDEVDRMFDLGFKKDVQYLFNKVPEKAQKLVFSATFDDSTKDLCSDYLNNPEFIHVHQEEKTPQNMQQEAIICPTADKIKLLLHFLKEHNPTCAIVFTNTKLVAAWLHYKLEHNNYNAQMISGDLPQNKRTKLISDIKAGKVKVLIATDVASRGLHISQVSHVYNFDLPQEAANYVHRIGRTARGGAIGASYSFICEDYGHSFEAIQKLLGNEAPKPQQIDPSIYSSVEDLAVDPYAKKSKKAPQNLKATEPVGGFKRTPIPSNRADKRFQIAPKESMNRGQENLTRKKSVSLILANQVLLMKIIERLRIVLHKNLLLLQKHLVL